MRGEVLMRVMFIAYLVLIATGLVYCTLLGLLGM
jgi:hypothetical protein